MVNDGVEATGEFSTANEAGHIVLRVEHVGHE